MRRVARPIEVVNGAVVDFDLHRRAAGLGRLDFSRCKALAGSSRPARQSRAETGCRVSNQWKGANTMPGRRRLQCENHLLANRPDERCCLAQWQDHSSAAMRPADHADPFTDNEGLGLQEPQRAVGVVRPLRPGPDATFAIRRHVARPETIGKQYDVTMRGQKFRPSCLARNERASLEKAVAAMKRHDRRKRTDPVGFHQQPVQQRRFATRQRAIQRRKKYILPRQRRV